MYFCAKYLFMEYITYIVVDDEPLAHDALGTLMENYPNFICIGNFYNAFEAQNFLLNNIFLYLCV